MSILLSEDLRLEKKKIAEGRHIESIFNHRFIKDKEAVGIYLHKFYASTETLIYNLLKHDHAVTLCYKGLEVPLHNVEEWTVEIQDPDDQIHTIRVNHRFKQIFNDTKKEWIEQQNLKKERKRRAEAIEMLYTPDINNRVCAKPESEEEMHSLLSAFAPLYEIEYDVDNEYSMRLAYAVIQEYLSKDEPYSRPAPVIDADLTPFAGMFATGNIIESGVSEPECISIGNPELLEDLTYKCQHSTVLLDSIISDMV